MGVNFPFGTANAFQFEPTGISTIFTGSYNSNSAATFDNGLTITGISTFSGNVTIDAGTLSLNDLHINLDADSSNNNSKLRLGTMGSQRPLIWTDVPSWTNIANGSTSHPKCVFIGTRVFGDNPNNKGTTYDNVFIGYEAAYSLGGTVEGNVFIGHRSGEGHTGSGYYSAPVTRSTNNTAVGNYAGSKVNNSSNCSFLGYNSGTSLSPSGAVSFSSNIICLGDNNVTQLYCADTSISSSDSRDKTDVEDFTAGLSFINALRPVTYRWDKRSWYIEHNEETLLDVVPDGSKKNNKLHIGFLAQEVESVERSHGFANTKEDQLIVNLNEDDTAYGIKYERLVPVLVNGIKELNAVVEQLKAEIEELKNTQ